MQQGDGTRALLGEIDAYIEELFAPRDAAQPHAHALLSESCYLRRDL